MPGKNLSALLFLCAAFFIFSVTIVRAQDETEPTTASSLTDANLPWGAQRVLPEKIPAEINEAFENLLKQGAGKIAGGEREVLLWAGDYKNRTNAAKFTAQIQTNFRKEGWQYETAGRNDDIEFFTLSKEGSPRRVVLGFFVPGDEVMVCALLEVTLPDSKSEMKTEIPNRPIQNNDAKGSGIYGKWFRTTGSGVRDWTGKTTLKAGEDFTFEFFPDGTVEYTRKKDVLSIMQCKINATDNARGRFSLNGNALTINLGAMKSVQTNSCDAKENYNKTLGNSTITVQIQIKQLEDITRPDKPTIMCFDGNEVCYEKQP
jgi:hypothetical protein